MTGPAPTRQAYVETNDPGRENRRVEWTARLVTHAPMLAKLPGLAHDLVAEADGRGIEALNNLVTDARDTQAFMALKRDIGLFAQRDPEDQRLNWEKMPRAQQQAYERNGYQPPAKSDGQLMHMGLGPLGNPLTDKLGDIWNDTGGRLQSGLGEAASGLLHAFDVIAKSPAALYRDIELNGVDSLNPAHFVDNWRSTWAGEKVFDPDVVRSVRETFDDEDAFRYVKRLAAGETVADMAKDFGAPGTAEYGQGYGQLQDFAQNELVQAGVRKLMDSHISPGRDLANGLGLATDDPAYTVISGGADFAWTFLLDPTILAGKAHKAYMASKWGLEIAEETSSVGGRIERVRSFFNAGEFAELDARVIKDVTNPRYWEVLANTKVDKPARMAAAIADHAHQGQWSRLQQAVPETSALIETLEDYQRASHGGLRSARDVARFYEKQVGATAIANGTFANYLGEYNALPRLSGWGAMRINDKVQWAKAIDFLDDAPVRLTAALEAGETVAPLDRLVTGLQLDHIAGGFKKLTTLVPSVPYLAFDGPQTPETLSRLLDFGVTGEQRHLLFDQFVTAGTDEARRSIMRNTYRTIFTNIGAYDDPRYGPLVRKWLETDLQKFALDDLDIVEGASGRAPAGIWEIDRAKAVAIPQFREISAAMRRDRLTGFLTGTVNSHFAEQFMRYWKPAVLLRPAFALRVSADEALLQFARFGLGHPVKSWVTLPLGGKGDEVPLWFAKRMHTGADAIFDAAETGYGHTIYGGLASVIAGGVDRAAETLELPASTALLRKAARATLTRADVVAYRDLTLAHEAVQAERARAAAEAGLDPKVFKALHPRQWRELAEYDFVHRSYAQIGGVDLGVLGSGVHDDRSIIELNRGTTDAPRTVRFRATGSEYDIYTKGRDELMLPIYANTVGRLQASPVAKAMINMRQVRMDATQAERIVTAMGSDLPGTVSGTATEQVQQVREILSSLYPTIRRRIVRYLDTGDVEQLHEALDRMGPGPRGAVQSLVASFEDSGRWVRHDLHALMVDTRTAQAEASMIHGPSRVLAPGAEVTHEIPIFYHGGKDKLIDEFDPDAVLHSGTANLFGPGLYTTSSPSIAASYIPSGGRVYQLGWLGDDAPKLLEVQRTAIPDDVLREVADLQFHQHLVVNPHFIDDWRVHLPDDVKHALETIDHDLSPHEFVEQVHDILGSNVAYRTARADHQALWLAGSDADKMELFKGHAFGLGPESNHAMDAMRNRMLRDEWGYDGITHLGGVSTGGRSHDVTIWFDASKLGRMALPEESIAAAENAAGLMTFDSAFNTAWAAMPEAAMAQRRHDLVSDAFGGDIPWLKPIHGTGEEAGELIGYRMNREWLLDRSHAGLVAKAQAIDTLDDLAATSGDRIFQRIGAWLSAPSRELAGTITGVEADLLRTEIQATRAFDADAYRRWAEFGDDEDRLPDGTGISWDHPPSEMPVSNIASDYLREFHGMDPSIGFELRYDTEGRAVLKDPRNVPGYLDGLDDIESRLRVLPTRVTVGPETITDAHWWSLYTRSQHGDRDAAQELEELTAARRMRHADVAEDYANIDRNARHITDEHAAKLAEPALVAAVGDTRTILASSTATDDEIYDSIDRLRVFADDLFPGRLNRIHDRAGMDALLGDLDIDHALPTLSSRLADNAKIQRQALDQVLLSDHGEDLHEMMRPLADGKFTYNGHVTTSDLSRLPSRVHGPVLEEIPGDTTAERITRWGFDHISHTIAAISRRPLWHRMYANAWEQAERQVGPYLRNARLGEEAKRFVGDLDQASDALWEATMKLSPLRRGGGADALTEREISDVLSGVKGYRETPTSVLTVRDWWRNEQMTREQLSRIAMTRATRDITPFIHDAKLRSQFAENARNIFPFWFAQEQFFKRWGRTIAAAPESIRRVQMAHHALQASGWVERNEQGEEVFVYPGAEFVTNAIARAAEILWPGSEAFTLPIAATLTGQLEYASPGYDALDRGGLPAPGPLVAVTVSALRRLDPETFAPVEEAIMGPRGARRSLPDILIPPTAIKLYRAVTADEHQLASATIGAMQLLELADQESRNAGGKGVSFVPGADSTAQEREDYLSRIKHWARILLFSRALVGAVGPAAPSPELDPDHLSPEYLSLIRSGMPIEEATRRFLVEHPDATAYMIFASSSPSGAPTDPTASAYKVLTDNEAFFKKHREAGAWLLPDGQDEGFDQKAWDSLFALKLRDRRDVDEFYNEIKFREAAPDFFAEQDRKDAAKLDHKGNGAAQRAIDAAWASWRDDYLAQHPVFAERYNNPTGPDRRAAVLKDIRGALADPERPEVDHADMLTRLLDEYDSMSAALERIKNDRSDRGIAGRRRIKQAFATWAQAFSAAHPTVDAFFRRILEPELDLPPVVVGP